MLGVIKRKATNPILFAHIRKRLIKLPSVLGPQPRLGSLVPQNSESPPPSLPPPLSLCSITPFLLNVFQSIKTLGSIRTEQRGYDKVSFVDYPAPPPHPHPHTHTHTSTTSSSRKRAREGENMYLLSSTKWGRKDCSPPNHPRPSFSLSLYFSPANSLHFSPPLLIISIGRLLSSLYSAELICCIGL